MNSIKKLELLVEYYSARGCGHTNLMLHGLAGSDNAILVAHTVDYGKQLARDADCDLRAVLSIDQLDELRGLHSPLAIDNFALQQLLVGAISEYGKLAEANARLVEKINQIEDVIRRKW